MDEVLRSKEPYRSRGRQELESLEGRLREIKRWKRRFILQVMGWNAAIYFIMLAFSHWDIKTANFAFTSFFQYQCIAYACFWMLPYFLRVEAKQDVGLAMGHDSVDIMEEVRNELRPILGDLKSVVDGIRPIAERGTLEKIEEDMKAIRAAIEKQTAPIPVRHRPADQDLQIESRLDGEIESILGESNSDDPNGKSVY